MDDNQKEKKLQQDELEEETSVEGQRAQTENTENLLAEREARIHELEQQLAEEKDAKLRALADCQNIRMRAAREKEELLAFSQTSLLAKLLDLADDFKNVVDNRKDGDNDAEWYNGVLMVYQKLLDIINSEGVEEVTADIDDRFDHTVHEAIGFVTVKEDDQDQKIVKVVSKGYRRKDGGKLIRASKVIVNKKE